MDEITKVFDTLRRTRDWLEDNQTIDNEAVRHDQLVLPVLSSPLILGWDHKDLLAQQCISVPSKVRESHILRNAVPKIRRPDVLVFPDSVQKPVAVVEEKGRQETIVTLDDHRLQLLEYLSLYKCVWGVLTDGNRWIVQRQFKSHFCFDNLEDIKQQLTDFREAIGKATLLERLRTFGTPDVVFMMPLKEPHTSSHGTGSLPIDSLPILLRQLNDLNLQVESAQAVFHRQKEIEMGFVDLAHKHSSGEQDDPIEADYLEAAYFNNAHTELQKMEGVQKKRDQLREKCRQMTAQILYQLSK